MYDRAMQALYVLALDPVPEITADSRSFGFRKGRCTQVACAYIFASFFKKISPEWALEGDIKGCFDNISHEWLIANIPMDKSVLLVVTLLSMCSSMGADMLGGGVGSFYTSQDADLTGTEQDYAALEHGLQSKIDCIELDYPGYDEYCYELEEIMHDPHELAALLTVFHRAYTRAEVQAEL